MMTTPEQREAIARIIDPKAWHSVEDQLTELLAIHPSRDLEEVKVAARELCQDNYDAAELDRNRSLAKADAILATPDPRLQIAREALEPFAQIAPSSLYPSDGSENEAYCVLLAPTHGNPVVFTGIDLRRARGVLSQLLEDM